MKRTEADELKELIGQMQQSFSSFTDNGQSHGSDVLKLINALSIATEPSLAKGDEELLSKAKSLAESIIKLWQHPGINQDLKEGLFCTQGDTSGKILLRALSQAVEKAENALLKELMTELQETFLLHKVSTENREDSYVFMNALNKAARPDLAESKEDLLSARKLAFYVSKLWNYPSFEDEHRLKIFCKEKVEDLEMMKMFMNSYNSSFMNAHNPQDLPGDLEPLFSDVE